MSHQSNVLLANQKEERQETVQWCVCEQIKSPAEFQSFSISFQSLTTDLEMLISHLLIADSRSRPFPHFWWMNFENRKLIWKAKAFVRFHFGAF